MYRYKLHIEYDGTGYSGWQKQENAVSIQETIEHAIHKLTKIQVTLHCAGRTDTGVHAIEQVAHFDMEKYFENHVLKRALNHFLKGTNIAISTVCSFTDPNQFHARFSASARSYTYKILNRNYPLTFQKNLYWWVAKPINVNNMFEASQLLLGTHDFSSFRAAGCQASSPIRTINSITVYANHEEIILAITAKSFLYHQVRNIMGSLVLVGLGKWNIATFKNIFHAKDRKLAGPTAPAHGLYLQTIHY
ncbi:tRNA pseudouridine synthase A [Candidatus Hepatincola sp. Pdp]